MLVCDRNCTDVVTVKHFQNMENIRKESIKVIMISESFPKNADNYFDGNKEPVFIENTNYLFNRNGYNYKTYADYLNNGIYLTTAIKCIKTGYLVSAKTIEMCSHYLEMEIESFANIEVILLMGDFAIKAVNYIWKRKYNRNIIPNGSTYKIRNGEYRENGISFIPSYTQTGESFGIEKGKLEMMKEDVGRAMKIIENSHRTAASV
jgi:uracil-DNA glycosylase